MSSLGIIVTNGLSLLGVSVTIAGIAGPLAWVVASAVSKHSASRWLQAHQAELDTAIETHKATLTFAGERQKLMLKRQELMFDREFAAAEDFFRVYRSLYPKQRGPDPDWIDAQIDIAENIGRFQKEFERFLIDHTVAISPKVIKYIESALNRAIQLTYEVGADTQTGEYGPGEYPGNEVRINIDDMIQSMDSALGALREQLVTGSLLLDGPLSADRPVE